MPLAGYKTMLQGKQTREAIMTIDIVKFSHLLSVSNVTVVTTERSTSKN